MILSQQRVSYLEILDAVNKTAVSDFTKKLVKFIFDRSKELTVPVSITVHSLNQFSFNEIKEAVGEIEDLCGHTLELNSTLGKQSAQLELFACSGGYEGDDYSSRKLNHCTFWLSVRRMHHKVPNEVVPYAAIAAVDL